MLATVLMLMVKDVAPWEKVVNMLEVEVEVEVQHVAPKPSA
jgi:hypothetical protein